MVREIKEASPFAAHLDMHGWGSERSWYAQIGYTYDQNELHYYCQAYSYNSNAPRFIQILPQIASFDTWTTFEIRVVKTDVDWKYAFRYFLNGKEVCYYQPVDLWDGFNKYWGSQRRLEVHINTDDQLNTGEDSIIVLADNFYRYSGLNCK